MSAQAVFLCVFNVNISLYDWHVCFCLSAAGADAVYCCLFTAQTARNPEQLPSLSCAGTQRRPVLCHRWDQVSQKMRTLTLLDREIKKRQGQKQSSRGHPVPADSERKPSEQDWGAAAGTPPQIITLLHNNHLLDSNSLCWTISTPK